MRSLKSLGAAASLGLSLVACADRAGSITGTSAAPTSSVVFQTGSGPAVGEPQPIAIKPGAPLLESTHASFWAVQGRRTGVVIAYRGSVDRTSGQPFLEFTVPKQTQLVDPDGRPLARGDSILIDVHVVPGRLEACFSPHGLVFAGHVTAKLAIHYGYGDLQGQAARLLGMWYRSAEGAAWEEQRSKIDKKRELVVSDIGHFSNYAVAFRR
jgi:hypothetical protein